MPVPVPGPVARLARDRLRVAAIALLSVSTLLVAGVQTGAVHRFERTLDAEWRGAYDLLVTGPIPVAEHAPVAEAAPGASPGVSPGAAASPAEAPARAAGTVDLFPPNTLGGAEGLMLEQVAAVRAVAGVEVAAPVGQVAFPLLGSSPLYFAVPIDEGTTEPNVQAYRATVRYVTDDGLGERLVDEVTVQVMVDDADLPTTIVTPVEDLPDDWGGCTLLSDGQGERTYTLETAHEPGALRCRSRERTVAAVHQNGGTWSSTDVRDGYVLFEVQRPPQVLSTLTLVDPVAEAALLGEAGAFLAPLTALPAEPTTLSLAEWAATAGGGPAEKLADLLRKNDELARQGFEAAVGEGFMGPGATYVPEPLPVLPVVTSTSPDVELRVEVSVESLGVTFAGTDDRPGAGSPHDLMRPLDLPPALDEATPGTPLGTVERDISSVFVPFVEESIVLPWPGTPAGRDLPQPSRWSLFPHVFAGATVRSPEYERTGEAEAVLHAGEYAATAVEQFNGVSGSAVPIARDATEPGAEAAYVTLPERTGRGFTVAPQLAPVGELDPAAVRAALAGLADVPLGGYDPVRSTLVAGPDGRAVDPVELRPSVSGLGLVNRATTMVGSFEHAAGLAGKAPVSAVRVRVAGIDDYSTANLEKVLAVKEAIEALGLTATLVAGSSPSPVAVTVEDYAFGTLDSEGAQHVGRLGIVEQQWSELGAAARVDVAVGDATTLTLVVGLGATALLVGAAQLVGVPRRRREAAVLALVGWPRGRIARWFVAEDAVGVAVIAVAGAVAVSLAADRRVTAAGVSAVLGLVVVLGLVSVAAAVARPGRSAPALAASDRAGTNPAGTRRRRTTRPQALVLELTDGTGPASGTGTSEIEVVSLGEGAAPPRPRSVPRALGVALFGLHQARQHRAFAAAVLLTTVIVGLGMTVLGVVVLDERERAGESLLATALVDQVLVLRCALAVVALAAGAVLAVLSRRLDLRLRAAQEQVLRAMGWTGRDRRRAHRAEALAIVLPSVLVTALACRLLAGAFRPDDVLLLLALGAGSALLTGLLTLLSPRKDLA
ncbi:hypothetical protein [Antribacter gilvus]|uniref:hypothetical protein n=1 Tax=Antribacter gilvus TaxID=2304675 RepID=UPI000F776ED3|nr:hypothetical protein [Antribacter gilvus]